MRRALVRVLLLAGLAAGVTAAGVRAAPPPGRVHRRTIPHVHPANPRALPPGAPAVRTIGPGGPPPLGAAGPPPLGAAGPPPLGAAGPPPLGAGQPRIIDHVLLPAPASRCVGNACAAVAMPPAEDGRGAVDEIIDDTGEMAPDDAEEMAPGE